MKKDSKTQHEREKELVARGTTGDAEALRELVELHKDRLHAFLWRMVRNHHDAEDICQDAFLKAFASLDSFSSEYRFSTWLFTIGYRVCLNHLRRRRTTPSELDISMVPVSAENPTDSVESEEASKVRETVWSAVERLTTPQRAAVLLFYRHELGCQEIAQVLQLPAATVKSHLHRARAKLRELLAPITETDWIQYRNLSERAG